MEELLYLLVIIIIGAFVVIPIILLVKLNSANNKIDFLQFEINSLNKKILGLIDSLANKQDIEQILKDIFANTDKQTVVRQENKEVTKKTEERIVVKEEIVEETIVNIPTDLTLQNVEEVIQGVESEEEIFYAAAEASQPPLHRDLSTLETQTSKIIEKIERVEQIESEQEYSSMKNLIERIFGENWLPKIGIVTLVLGVAFFVKYAIDQNWINEVGRAGIGILTGAIIIGIAHRLKEKYKVFSSLLVGGGISILYITITLAFREYELFNQTVAFILLILITVFSVILSLYYNRQELAIFSLIGGFSSPLMVSTGSGNYIVLFSFILILNTGMLAISLARNWRLIGIISYMLSLIFFWGWLTSSFHDQFVGATVFVSLFFVQFYLLAIIKHFKEQKELSIFQTILILTNNLSILLALMFIFDNYKYDIRGLIVIMIAVFNAIVMLSLFRGTKVDKNLIYLIIGIVMSFVTLAIPIQLQGYVITMFWAVEMVLLLWLWQRTKINIFRLGFLALAPLTIISYLMDINNYYVAINDGYLGLFINSAFITGIVVIIGFAASLFLLRKENIEDIIIFRGKELFSLRDITLLLRFILILLVFFVPYLEFNYQLEVYTDTTNTDTFRYLTLATYTTCFVAALAILFRNKLDHLKYVLFLTCVIIYTIAYTWLVSELRLDIFYRREYPSSYFLIHFLSLPAIGYLIYLLIANIKAFMQDSVKIVYWTLVILCNIILSVELDNIIILISNNPESYFAVLYDVHTFGYPILWGLIAMLLMIWGVRKKEVILRQISLTSFGLIILKFYAYDVWLMSQTGRILSFVLLGIIILIVSFIQQKIKVLVKEDDQSNTSENQNKES